MQLSLTINGPAMRWKTFTLRANIGGIWRECMQDARCKRRWGARMREDECMMVAVRCVFHAQQGEVAPQASVAFDL